MALRQSDDTEFNDALIAHGIIPPRPKTPPSPDPVPEDPSEPVLDFDDELLNEDDLPTSVIEAYRNARLQDMKQSRARARFGRIYPIQKVDYTREVTEASQDGDEGTGVVCFLYQDSILESRILGEHLQRLAQLYPSTKFVSIVGNMCIEGYPDRNIPTLLIYRGGELLRQVVGLLPAHGLRGQKTSLQDVENLLISTNALDPELRIGGVHSGGDSEEEDDEHHGAHVRRNGIR